MLTVFAKYGTIIIVIFDNKKEGNYMKKLLSTIIALSFITPVFAAEEREATIRYFTNEGYYFEYEEYLDGAKVTACVYDGKESIYSDDISMVLPKEIDGKKVLAVSGDFLDEEFEFVEIEAELDDLPENSFAGHKNLYKITLNEGLKKIGNNSFSKCYSLKKITMPQTLEEIGRGCFSYCQDITKIEIPDNVNKIGKGSFVENPSLKDIDWDMTADECGADFGEKTPWLESYAQEKEWLKLNKGKYLVKYIGTNPVVTIPSGSTLNPEACSGNTVITEVTAKNSTIPDKAFSGCISLQKAIISGGTIGANVFENCTSLSEAELNPTMKNIPFGTFIGCTALKNFEVSDQITDVGRRAFYNSGLENITIPDKTKDKLFAKVYDAAEGTPWGENISKSEEFFVIDGQLLKYNGTDKNPVIPSTVKVICKGAFDNAKYIEGVTIPQSVKEIASAAFYNTNLKEITIPQNVKKIGTLAFGECYDLASLTIKGSCTVGESAFYNCINLKHKDIAATADIAESAFEISEEDIPNDDKTIGLPQHKGTFDFERFKQIINLYCKYCKIA